MNVLVLGGAVYGWGIGPQGAIIAGLTMAFSSTAAVLALMVERNETVTHHGRITVAVLILQDLAVVLDLAE